ncbi:MAG: hypothetical protein ACE15D_18940 [Candidatus Eisenbacteria bacterium]
MSDGRLDIYLDLETIPGQDPGLRNLIAETITHPAQMSKPETIAKWEAEQKPAAIEEAWRKTALDGAYGQIACAAIAVNDEPVVKVYREDWEDECKLLKEIFVVLTDIHKSAHGRRGTYVGHNVLGFDLRFMRQRAIVRGVVPPPWIPFKAKPWDDAVFDTMTEWAGVRDTVSLDKLCRVFGIPPKGAELDGIEIDGSLVWDFVQAGRIADVATYCAGDVDRARLIHKRMTFAC